MADVTINAPAAAATSTNPLDVPVTDVKIVPLAATATAADTTAQAGETHKLLAAKAAYEQSSLYLKWKRDNPREYGRIEHYWQVGDRFPVTVNAFGLAYALVADAYWDDQPVLPFIPV